MEAYIVQEYMDLLSTMRRDGELEMVFGFVVEYGPPVSLSSSNPLLQDHVVRHILSFPLV